MQVTEFSLVEEGACLYADGKHSLDEVLQGESSAVMAGVERPKRGDLV